MGLRTRHVRSEWSAEQGGSQPEPEGEPLAVVVAGLQDVLDREFGEVGELVGGELVEKRRGHRWA
jgi:hypothetical protein